MGRWGGGEVGRGCFGASTPACVPITYDPRSILCYVVFAVLRLPYSAILNVAGLSSPNTNTAYVFRTPRARSVPDTRCLTKLKLRASSLKSQVSSPKVRVPTPLLAPASLGTPSESKSSDIREPSRGLQGKGIRGSRFHDLQAASRDTRYRFRIQRPKSARSTKLAAGNSALHILVSACRYDTVLTGPRTRTHAACHEPR